MDAVRRVVGKLCGKLPGRTGLVGYVVCCVLPCRACFRKKPEPPSTAHGTARPNEQAASLLPSQGTRQVLLLGLEGVGKSSFLWFCEHPYEDALPAESLPSTDGVARVVRKAVPVETAGCSVDLDISEVGGSDKIRSYWPNYIQANRAARLLVIFCDATRPERIGSVLSACGPLQRIAPQAEVLLVLCKWASAEGIEVVMPTSARDASGMFASRTTLDLGGLGARKSADALLQTIASLVV